jgi:hypothetical protein
VPFPNLKPSQRSFNPGEYPIKRFRSQSGFENRILYGSNRTAAQLQLTFENITNANANLFVQHYDETKGAFSPFDLPGNAFAGSVSGNFNPGSGNRWTYGSPPEIASVYNNLSTVTVRLVAVL